MDLSEKGRAAPQYEVRDAINDKEYRESDLIEAAIATGEEETKLSLRVLFRTHGKAAMWSMLLSLALVMEGMDVGLVRCRFWPSTIADHQVNNFFGQQAYVDRFGFWDAATQKKYIPADWQAAINNGQQIGAIAGLLLNGWAQSKFGSRKMYMLAMAMLAACSESLQTICGHNHR